MFSIDVMEATIPNNYQLLSNKLLRVTLTIIPQFNILYIPVQMIHKYCAQQSHLQSH